MRAYAQRMGDLRLFCLIDGYDTVRLLHAYKRIQAMTFFSEREEGERPRDSEQIGETASGGLQALIRARMDDGSFGASYPEACPDGLGPVGTNENSFWQAMQ